MSEPQASKALYFFPESSADLPEIARQLGHYGYTSRLYASLDAVCAAAGAEPPAAVLIDYDSLPAPGDAAPATLFQLAERLPLICIASRGDVVTRLSAVRMGCQAYLARPINMTGLLDTLDRLTAPPQEETGRVLIVDDSRSLATFYAAHLGAAGFHCQIVNDPLRTLEALSENPPDLILLDMNMPGASGQEIAHIIRQEDAYLSVPIVFLSAETNLDRQREAMSHGGDEFLQKPIEPTHLVSAVKSRVSRYRALRALMVRDSLTGLLNHTTFKERLRLETARAERQGKPLAVALIDIDHFKRVNDQYGHPVGDRVIKNLSRLLKQRLRGADLVGRYGGEEFAVGLLDAPLAISLAVIEQIRQAFEAIEQRSGEQVFSSTFSAGVAALGPGLSDAASLIKAADEALYSAKRNGRNQVHAYPATSS